LNPTIGGDNTAVLQAALDSEASTVIIDKITNGWTTGPLFLTRSNVQIIIEPDVMVRATDSGYPGLNDCLLTVADQSNVTISGYGATIAMNKPAYTTGEWRMALSLLSVHDTLVEGLTLCDSGGDGIYLGRGSTPYCTNVTIRDVTCDNNRRNGMSVITVDGLTVEGCAFTNTSGTAPQFGLDFEPNNSDERLANITFSDCVFERNIGGGWECYAGRLSADSEPVSISVGGSTIGRQSGGYPSVWLNITSEVTGAIELHDSLIHVGACSGAYALINKPADGIHAVMSRTTTWDTGNSFYYYGPLTIASGSISAGKFADYGGADFNDCVVVTDLAPPFFKAYDGGAANALTDVHGTVTVSDPHGVQADFGAQPTDVDLAVRTEPPGTVAPVRVSASSSQVSGGATAEFIFTRLGGDLTTPLAIAYTTSGTARERYDYGGLGKVAVIPPGATEVTVPVRTFARRQDGDPERRSLVVSIAPGLRYEPAPRPSSVEVTIV
jgi:hypothetical protein